MILINFSEHFNHFLLTALTKRKKTGITIPLTTLKPAEKKKFSFES